MGKERQPQLFVIILCILIASLTLVSCRREAPTPPTPVATSAPSIPSAPAASPAPGVIPAPSTPSAPAAGITLQIREPQDESVLSTSPVRVSGVTALDAIVSINGNIVEVGDDGTFSTNISLLEGPNLLEIMASDYQGNQVSRIITVIYVP